MLADERLKAAVTLHREGRLAQASDVYREVLDAQPDQPDALQMLGVLSLQAGKLDDGISLIRRSLAINPRQPQAYLNLGEALLRQDRPQEAASALAASLQLDPGSVPALVKLGHALRRLNLLTEALNAYARASSLASGSIDALNGRGNVLRALGQLEEAARAYEHAVALNPGVIESRINLAETRIAQQQPEAALVEFRAALKLQPTRPDLLAACARLHLEAGRAQEALADVELAIAADASRLEYLNLRGTVLATLKRHEDALECYGRSLAIDGAQPEVMANRAAVLLDWGRAEAALRGYDEALAQVPDNAEAWNHRGTALARLNRIDEALASYTRAIEIAPDLASAHINKSKLLVDNGQPGAALDSLQRALALAPSSAVALNNLASALFLLDRQNEAADVYAQLVTAHPDMPYAHGHLCRSFLYACDWQELVDLVEHIARGIDGGRKMATPSVWLPVSTSAGRERRCAEVFMADRHPPSAEPLWRGQAYGHERIRVAYLSADLRDHAVAQVAAGLFAGHDRRRFEIFALSTSRDHVAGPMRLRLEQSFEHFIDAASMSDAELAARIRELEIDLVIDLTGHTAGGRPGVLALRPAPIQVNFLGYAGTMGAPYYDYLIADTTVIPPGSEAHYTEHVVRLPDCYMPQDDQRRISAADPSWQAARLPADGFVFCCFNSHYKITPALFAVWMDLLRDVPDSVLWLRAANADATANLQAAAERAGIDPARIVFAGRVASPEEHLARHRLADLFLDTLPYNAHATAADALWAGLPVITCRGETFASRVASSLLNALGMPDLVTDSLEAYRALALDLATNRHRLAEVHGRLARARSTAPLFRTQEYIRQIEAAFVQMWQRHERGAPPVAFNVAQVPHQG